MNPLERVVLLLLTSFSIRFVTQPDMKKFLALLLAACSSSPVTEAGPALLEARAPAAAADRLLGSLPSQPKTLAAMAVTAPLGTQILHTGGITLTIQGHLAAAQTNDGGWVIQVPEGGCTLLGYSSADGTTGAALNWPGWKAATFDGPFIHRDLQVAAGTRLMPEDALIVASGATNPGSRGPYPYAFAGRSGCDEMAAFVFVRWPVSSDVLRPPAIGAGPIARFFRSAPVPLSSLDVDHLPAVVDLTGSDLTPDYLTALNRPFCGEVAAGWFTDGCTPDFQNPGYGREVASVTSCSSLGMVSTWPAAQKRPLAIAMAQRGFDLVGAFGDGRQAICGGGHSQGRKAYIVWLGHLLHIDLIANPTAILGPVFGEDQQYFRAFPAWWFGWTAGWRFKPLGESPLTDGSRLLQLPSSWGDFEAADHSTWGWMVNGYLEHCCGSQIGTALAMSLIGRTKEMGQAHFDMIYQFMQGPPDGARQQLQAAGCRVVWGRDYAAGRGSGAQATAWRQHIH